MKSIRPLNDRVLIKRIDAQEKTAGGILIPDNAKEKQTEAEVIAVGPGRLTDDGDRRPLEVKPGNRVLFGKWAGTEVKLDNNEYLLVKEDEIVAIIER